MASDTENKAQMACRILAGKESRVSFATHVLHLAVQDFLSAYTTSRNALLASSVVTKVRRIARAFLSSPTWSDNLMRMQRESNVRSPLKYIIDVETRCSSLYLMFKGALCLHSVAQDALKLM